MTDASLSPNGLAPDLPSPPRILRPRRPWGWVVTGIGGVCAAAIAWSFWSADTIDHATIADYLFDPAILQGALRTIELTAAAMVMGILIGIGLALMGQSSHP